MLQLGTDSWRGPLGEVVTPETVTQVTQAFAAVVPAQQVAIAYDGRHRSPEFAEIVARVLRGNGRTVYLAGEVTPTPVLSWWLREQGLDAGIMVTASHNPATDNGLKFKAAYGGPLDRATTQAIAQAYGQQAVQWGDLPPTRVSMLPAYCAHLAQVIDLDAIRAAALPVVVDVMHGAVQGLFSELVPSITTLAGTVCPNFGQRCPEPIQRNLAPLQAALQTEPHYAVGLATDGDGDRLGVMLDGGRWLGAQDMILLLSRHLIQQRQVPGIIVKTAAVTDKLALLGRPVREVPVGFQAITQAMVQESVAIGCEESGGYGCALHLPERDGMFTGLLLLELLALSGERHLSACLGEPIAYERRDLRLEAMPDLASLLGAETFVGSRVQDVRCYQHPRGHLNGVKYYLPDAWVMWRCSETEPLARVYVEADNPELLQHYMAAAELRLRCSLSTAS